MIAWLGGLGLPASILLTGWLVTTRIEDSKLDSEYVKIALGILSTQTKDKDGVLIEPTQEDAVLRLWAVRLLNRKSPEKFTKEEQEALASGRQRLPPFIPSAEKGLGLSWISPVGPLKFTISSPASSASSPSNRIQRFQFEVGTAF
ncbi:MAG: BamA/TamA family outer membrane protein [Ramlibacter sp.]|nr:BamA/TamA family outer membrane protein [Ramlibacter sp.]